MKEFFSGEEAMDLLQDASDLLDDKFGPIILDENMPVLEGERRTDVVVEYHVGVKEFKENPAAKFSRAQLAAAVIVLFHEVCGHGGQVHCEFDKPSILSTVLALNYYACKGSSSYYGFYKGRPTDAYFRQPHEIAAQYTGLRSAMLFLTAKWGEPEAEQGICEAHDLRINDGSSYIENPVHYDSVQLVLKDLNDEFGRQLFRHRPYDLAESKYDVAWLYGKKHGNNTLRLRIKTCRNGVKQDWMMAAAYCDDRDKSGYVRTRPALSGLSMSVESAVGFRRPPVDSNVDKSELDLSQLSEHVRLESEQSLHDKQEDVESLTAQGSGELQKALNEQSFFVVQTEDGPDKTGPDR